jgi:hypothetical protein
MCTHFQCDGCDTITPNDRYPMTWRTMIGVGGRILDFCPACKENLR